jgi:hypothetical protein
MNKLLYRPKEAAQMLLDGRPAWPGGGFTSAATLRRI